MYVYNEFVFNLFPASPKRKQTNQVIGVVLILLGIVVGTTLVSQRQIFEPKASTKDTQNSQNTPKQKKESPLIARFMIPASKSSKEEKINIAIGNLEAKKDIIAFYYGKNNKSIPNGIVVDDRPKKSPYDKRWSWHLNPDTINMAEITIEVCDARPSYVEQHLDVWLKSVKRYCPWNLKLESIDKIKPLKKLQEGQTCAQVITRACLTSDKRICLDFANPCEVPDGWQKAKLIKQGY